MIPILQAQPSLDQLFGNLMQRADLVGVLLFILWAGAKGVWVYGREHARVLKDLDKFRDLALHGTHIADRALVEAERRSGTP